MNMIFFLWSFNFIAHIYWSWAQNNMTNIQIFNLYLFGNERDAQASVGVAWIENNVAGRRHNDRECDKGIRVSR